MNTKEQQRAEAALSLAIARAGGVTQLAEKLGVSKGAVSQWKVAPPARVLDIEKLTGLPRTDLRPDWYPEEG
jgi:DNA-binding transcriptional regulator YdaS (Cro superfamily)